MIFYHRTTKRAAKRILTHGFRDGVGKYLTMHVYKGVWISNVPLDVNEGACGDTLLEVQCDGRHVAKYEWIEEQKPYREWLVPAGLLNRIARIRELDETEEMELDARLRRRWERELRRTDPARYQKRQELKEHLRRSFKVRPTGSNGRRGGV